MTSLLVLFGILALPARAGVNSAQSGTLVLFGASWCAPCVAELRDLRRISEATAPGRVLIVWDGGDLARFDLPMLANVDVPTPERTRRLLAESASDRGGLPYAQMISGSGLRCAEHRGRVSAGVVERMKQACAAGPNGPG